MLLKREMVCLCLVVGAACTSVAGAETESLYPKDLSPFTIPSRTVSTPSLAQDPNTSYEQLLDAGRDALDAGNTAVALKYFYEAHKRDPSQKSALEYINLIYRLRAERVSPVTYWQNVNAELDRYEPAAPVIAKPAPVQRPVVQERPLESGLAPVKSKAVLSKPPEPRKKVVTGPRSKGPGEELSLDDILAAGDGHARIRIPLKDQVILLGRDIQKHLVVEQGVVQAKVIDRDRLLIVPERRGSTFLHIWDGRGRSTVYVEVLLPRPGPDEIIAQEGQSMHARPFVLSYSADRSSYHSGNSFTNLKRQGLSVVQNIGLDGETPYGDLDAKATMDERITFRKIPNYTVGLSGVPLKGTDDLNLRVFDASRTLSPLTMPGTNLRGVFLDTKLLDELVAVSLSHGKRQPSFGYFSFPASSHNDVVTDGARVVLFPGDKDNWFAVNYAQGSGKDRQANLTDKAYSIQGQRRIDKVTLNTELARDDRTTASSGYLQWEDGASRSRVSVRDINKGFTTVINDPSNKGELGATWTTDLMGDRGNLNTMVDVYRDRAFPNPNNSEAFNYDTSAHVKVPLDDRRWVDTNIRYVDTPGELSPRRYVSGDVRGNSRFDVWGGRKANVFAGGGHQRSRYAGSGVSEYDRSYAVTGFQIPMTQNLSGFANYEYSWLHETFSGKDFNPNVLNTGLSYQKMLTAKLRGNAGVSYRNEQNVEGANSFLAGEDSVAVSTGLSYRHTEDMTLFMDTRMRDVWSEKTGNPSYNDLDLRFGISAKWGSPVRWDPTGTVAGVVFNDKNGNGRIDPGEKGLSGVKVKVGEQETVTSQKGTYRMQVHAKRASVTPFLDNLPPGFILSTQSVADLEIIQGRTYYCDFGLTVRSGIYGVAYVDQNGNGEPDRGDRYIRGVKMVLDGETVQTTDGRGAYFFKNISEGKHTIELNIASVPIDLLPLVRLKNEISVAEGTTYFFHIPMQVKKTVQPAE